MPSIPGVGRRKPRCSAEVHPLVRTPSFGKIASAASLKRRPASADIPSRATFAWGGTSAPSDSSAKECSTERLSTSRYFGDGVDERPHVLRGPAPRRNDPGSDHKTGYAAVRLGE